MNPQNFTLTLLLNASPDVVFDAILDVRAWWSGTIDGDTDKVGATFRYRYADLHDSTQRVTELVRGEKLVWHVSDAHLSFVERADEWKGTDIVFELAPRGASTELTFTHVGLRAACECYGACSKGWTTLIEGNLQRRVASGRTQPDAFA